MAKKQGDYLSIDFIMDRKRRIVGMSPAIDMIMHGVSEGTLNIISGPEKSGKTTTLLHHAAKAQKQGFDVYYFNIENRLKRRDLESIAGLDLEKLNFVSSTAAVRDKDGEIITPARILTAEDYLTILERTIRDKEGTLCILDSESLLVSNNEYTSEITDFQRCEGSRLLAKFMRRNSAVISLNNHIVWVVRHIMANPNGMTGSSEKGARAIAYGADTKLQIKYTERWKDGEKQIGQKVHFQLECGFNPGAFTGSTCTGYLRYGYGLDDTFELATLATELGVAEMKGAWINYDGKKYQGMENFTSALRENQETQDKLDKELKELLK